MLEVNLSHCVVMNEKLIYCELSIVIIQFKAKGNCFLLLNPYTPFAT
jgi:hypothetical protein